MQQEPDMNHPIKMTNTLALLGAVLLLSLALARGISSDLHVPAARILVAECQGFEALATAGGKRLTCSAEVAALSDDTDRHEPSSADKVPATVPAALDAPVGPVAAPAAAHKKA